MLSRRALVWGTAGLALALLAAVALRPAPARLAKAARARSAAVEPERRASAPPPALAPAGDAARRPAAPPAERTAGHPPADDAPAPAPAGATAPSEPGRVAGLVSLHDGTPLAGALLALVEGPAGAPQRRARTDPLGAFAFERVAPGGWTLELHTQAPPVHDTMVGFATRLEVEPGRETWAPVQLEGERALSGRLTMELEGFDLDGTSGFVLLLELRPRWSSGPPVARARVHALERPTWERPRPTRAQVVEALADVSDFRLRNRIDPDDPGTWPPSQAPEWIAGSFRFEHLPADAYVLRVALEDNETVTTTIDGRRLELEPWLEREADLTAGDLELPAERLDFHRDFLSAAYERHLAAEARNPAALPTPPAEDP